MKNHEKLLDELLVDIVDREEVAFKIRYLATQITFNSAADVHWPSWTVNVSELDKQVFVFFVPQFWSWVCEPVSTPRIVDEILVKNLVNVHRDEIQWVAFAFRFITDDGTGLRTLLENPCVCFRFSCEGFQTLLSSDSEISIIIDNNYLCKNVTYQDACMHVMQVTYIK